MWLNSLLNNKEHFVGYLYIAIIVFTKCDNKNFFLCQISIMMVTLYSKNLIPCVLESDKIYGFINNVFIAV
jgi:hypothetical protein